MKNQIESIPGRCIRLPENYLQNNECHAYDCSPEYGPLIERQMSLRRDLRATVYQAYQFLVGFGAGDQADGYGYSGADESRPESAEHVFSHVFRLGREGDIAD